jgi:hypothetical protein
MICYVLWILKNGLNVSPCVCTYVPGQLRCLQTAFSPRASRAWSQSSPPVITRGSSEVLMVVAVVIVIVVMRVSEGDEDGDGKRFESQTQTVRSVTLQTGI